MCGGRAHGTIFQTTTKSNRGLDPPRPRAKAKAQTPKQLHPSVRLFDCFSLLVKEGPRSLLGRCPSQAKQARRPTASRTPLSLSLSRVPASASAAVRPFVQSTMITNLLRVSNAVCLLELTTGPFRYAYSASSRPIDQSVDRFIVWYACAVLSLFAASFSLPPCALVSVHHRNTFFHGVYI